MESGPITSWQIGGETMESVTRLYTPVLQNHCRWWLPPCNQKILAPQKKSYDKHSLVQSFSRVQLCEIPWAAAHQASLSITVSWSSLKLMSIELVMRYNHLTLCHPLLLLSIFPSIRVISRVSIFHTSIGASVSESVLPMNIQDWFPSGLTVWITLQSKELSRVFSNPTVQKHQFFMTQLSLWSNSHIHIWLLETPCIWLDGLCQQSNVSAF